MNRTIDEVLADSDLKKSVNRYWRQGRKELFPLIFIGKQWIIWEYLMSTEYTSTSKLSELTGMPSKNISTQLQQMSRTGLVKFIQNGKLKSWIKID